MRKITEIIVHCTATRADWWAGKSTAAKVAEIRRWHVQDRGWADIGYHFLIDRNGVVAKGRDIARDGAHVQGRNKGTIGISLFGGHGSAETDRFDQHFTKEQDAALRNLIGDLRKQYGNVPVTGHNQFAAKACPGFNVPKWLAGPQRPATAPQATQAAPAPAKPAEPITGPAIVATGLIALAVAWWSDDWAWLASWFGG